MKKCKVCLEYSDTIHKHHIVPRSLGGSNSKDNLIELCMKCHGKAHDIGFKTTSGLINTGIKKAKQLDEESLKWSNSSEYESDMLNFLNKILIKNEDLHDFILLSIKFGTIGRTQFYRHIKLNGPLKTSSSQIIRQ